MVLSLTLKEFLQELGPIFDVRSPSEFYQGHIPFSYSLAIFSDEERAQIGTLYKKQSRQEAIELGLVLAQPRLDSLLIRASSIMTSKGKILCWRGGMRSGFMACFLEAIGYAIVTLQGGYKTYRRWVLQKLDKSSFSNLHVLGGLTGSGKTDILQALAQGGEQVIDLEALASHRGSTFGGIGLDPQPTQEQFENELAYLIEQLDWTKPVWIEDESRLIGHLYLPQSLYQSMLKAPFFYVERLLEERLKHLIAQYGQASKLELLEAVKRIHKRLGSQLTKEVQLFIEQDQNEQAFERLLIYYDKTYQQQIAKRQTPSIIKAPPFATVNEWAHMLMTCMHRKSF